VLRSWGSEQALSDAGLFHSIYGTEGFQGYKLPFSRRADIRSVSHLYCAHLLLYGCAEQLPYESVEFDGLTVTFSQGTSEHCLFFQSRSTILHRFLENDK
jgi:hypothetical protein